jgi:sugar phosphate isomerase/epimerase
MPVIAFNSWTTGEGSDIVTDVEAARRAGFAAIEICDWKIERYLASGGQMYRLRDGIERAGLQVLTINTLDDSTIHAAGSQAEKIERCRQLCIWARDLNCPYIIAGPSYHRAPPVPPASIRRQSAEALREYARIAADHHVSVGFEFHGYATCSIRTVPDALGAVDDAGQPNIGLIIDAFHFHVGGTSLGNLAHMDTSRLYVVHLTDADHPDRASLKKVNRKFPGEGALPLKAFVEALKQAGYDGPYSLELLRPEYWTMDPFEVARRGMASMQRFV